MASTVWRGYISFGLISIPVRLYRAARPERVSFRKLYRETAPAGGGSERANPPEDYGISGKRNRPDESSLGVSDTGAVSVGKRAGPELLRSSPPQTVAEKVQASAPTLEPVRQVAMRSSGDVAEASNLVKGYEYQKGRYVALDPEELKNVAPKTSAAMEIAEFVRLAEVDPVYLETSYYVTPEDAGEKAYSLLYRSMQLAGLVAVAEFAMHGREHAVILRPARHGILAHTMYFASEVRADEEFHADVSALSQKELDLAQTLINSLSATFEPEKYRDTYRERVEELIAQKVSGEPAPVPAPAARQADVIDIADALRKSLANLKKPPVSTELNEVKPRKRKK